MGADDRSSAAGRVRQLTAGGITTHRNPVRRWARRGVMLLALGTPALARSAAAAPVLVRLDLVSPNGCGTSDELARRVAVRSARIRLSPNAATEHLVRVEIAGAGLRSFDATLTFSHGTGRRSSRRIQTNTCDEALEAIALVLAVTFDPSRGGDQVPPVGTKQSAAEPPTAHSKSAKPPPPGRPTSPEGGAQARPDDKPTTVVDRTPASESPRRLSAESLPRLDSSGKRPQDSPPPIVDIDVGIAAPLPVPSPAMETSFTGSAGLAGQATSAPSPSAMPGLGAYALLGWDRGSSVWSPRLRIAATHFWSSRFTAPGGTADFTLTLLAVDLCPVWIRTGSFGGGGCAGGAGGWLTAHGSRTFVPQSEVRPFAALGASAIVTFVTGGGIEISALVSGGAPLIRDQFQFRPAPFYQVPSLTVTGGVGLGLRFW